MRRTQYTTVGLVVGVLVAGLLYVSAPASAAEALVYDSPEAVRPLLVGTKIPTGTLKTGTGEAFDLAAAIAAKPTVLVFFRGSW